MYFRTDFSGDPMTTDFLEDILNNLNQLGIYS